MRNAIIKSTGSYAPDVVLTNSYFDQLFNDDMSSWLNQKMNIRERCWCNEDQSTTDLCVEAAQKALENGQLEADKLDLIIVGTDTPETISPSTASDVQYKLGAVNAGALDINVACSSFVAGSEMASRYIRSGDDYQAILVIGAYAMSKYLNKADKKTVTLFADGAGAALFTASEKEDRGFLGAISHVEGRYHGYMGIYAGGTRYPVSSEAVARGDHHFQFVKKFPENKNSSTWTMMIEKLCEKISLAPSDIDHYFMTQINIHSIHETMDNLNLPHSKAHTIMDKYAYTGAASVPMAIDDAVQRGKLKRGNRVVMITSGGGLAFAAAAFRY